MKIIDSQPSLAERAYAAILDDICDGQLLPGAHLIQEQLAEQLGVSRQPIQQAMALLKKDGLVEEAPGRGLRVAALNVAAMRGHYEVRGALDALAARMAAGHCAGSPDTAARAERDGGAIIEAGRKAIADGGVRDMVHHDVAFHGFLYACSGNPYLRQTAEPHWRFLRRVMGEVLRHAEAPAEIWRQHKEILDAVVQGDAALAEQRALHHVERASENLSDALAAKLQRHTNADRAHEAIT